MTSRERILAAIEHRQPDKVPVDLGATPSSGISAIAYGNLKNHLGLTQGHTRVYDVVQQLAQPEDFILDRFGVDALDIGRTFNSEDSAWQPTTLADGQAAQYPGVVSSRAAARWLVHCTHEGRTRHCPHAGGGNIFRSELFSIP